jgi:hypothetical protein
LLKVSKIDLRLAVSLPLRIAKLNTPEDVFTFVISHLRLSAEPFDKAPPLSSDPLLFIKVPLEIVVNVKGTLFTILSAAKVNTKLSPGPN